MYNYVPSVTLKNKAKQLVYVASITNFYYALYHSFQSSLLNIINIFISFNVWLTLLGRLFGCLLPIKFKINLIYCATLKILIFK